MPIGVDSNFRIFLASSLFYYLIFFSLQAQGNLQNVTDCSRFESRIARRIIHELILPAYDELGISLPDVCPWHPTLDLYGGQESRKIFHSNTEWECGFCGKHFHSETYLDEHMTRRHQDTLPKIRNGLCLADLCPILRCEVLHSSRPVDFWEKALCDSADMEKLRTNCLATVDQCVTVQGAKSQKLKKWLQKDICGYLTCESHWILPPPMRWIRSHGWLVAVVVCIFCLVVYYLFICLHFNQITGKSGPSASLMRSTARPNRVDTNPGMERFGDVRHRLPT